jgi:hypothetical protein
MPIPSTGQVSVSAVEAEYGKLAGRPSGIAEYSRPSTGVPNAAEGITLTGQVKFSDFRGKIAHPDARECGAILTRGISQHPFGGSPIGSVYGGAQSVRQFALAAGQVAWDNTDGRFTITSNFSTSASGAASATGFLGQKGGEAEQNTVIWVAVGKANGFTQLTQTRVNGVAVTPSYYPPTIDTGSGFLPVGDYASFNFTAKASIAAYTTPPGQPITSIISASHRQPENFSGQGDGDKDTASHAGIFLLPNKWQPIASILFNENAGILEIGGFDVAVVAWAGNNSPAYPSIPFETTSAGVAVGGGVSLNRLYQSQLSSRGFTAISLYFNPSPSTKYFSFANPTWRAYVTLFRFVGDGYLTSLRDDISYT